MFQVENHGSIILFRPMTEEAKDHSGEVFPDAQRMGDAVAVEPRYAAEIVERLREDGFGVE